ncbi:hypothetical protein [Polyangium mundeleinium]|uniref:Uncharacterized protein n=1 Tax=Polyangium mundeleinium TaxID=2995306 RepID=A0ABT5ERE3_9BACT|nr:hypothetical protein [Polyangium mundeleinium]MDC0744336.1 hypothetical protein [Polyangium mundeleinium]
MGRTIRGHKGFSYTYVEGEQPVNLLYLAAVSGAGMSLVVPEMVGRVAGDDTPVAWSCLALGRALVERGKASRQGELAALLRKLDGDWIRVDDPHHVPLEFVQDAMAENVVAIVERIDAEVERPLRELTLAGKSGYHLPRADWPKMLAFVNESLPRAKRLDMGMLRDAAGQGSDALAPQGSSLRGKVDFLPFMGLSILCHAVEHDLEGVLVHEDEPEVHADGFWDLALAWHDWLGDAAGGMEPSVLFARALVAHFARRKIEARRLLLSCADAGERRAARYLALLR